MIKDKLRNTKNACKKIAGTPKRFLETVKLNCYQSSDMVAMIDLANCRNN